jgi:hypothetical protein
MGTYMITMIAAEFNTSFSSTDIIQTPTPPLQIKTLKFSCPIVQMHFIEINGTVHSTTANTHYFQQST